MRLAGNDHDPNWTPRGAALWALAAYSLAACILGYPVFHGGFLVSPHSDQYIGGYAVREFGTAMIRSGHLPLWNPYIFGGMPFVGAFDGDIFYPPTLLLRLLLRADLAVTWAFILHVILAGWFTYLWLRASGLGFAAAGIGGLAYELGGPIASFVSPGHDGKLYVAALLPLALCLILLGVRDSRRWCWPVACAHGRLRRARAPPADLSVLPAHRRRLLSVRRMAATTGPDPHHAGRRRSIFAGHAQPMTSGASPASASVPPWPRSPSAW